MEPLECSLGTSPTNLMKRRGVPNRWKFRTSPTRVTALTVSGDELTVTQDDKKTAISHKEPL